MKLIRISLIIAILGGLAAGILNFVMVKEKIVTTIAQRDKNAQDRDTEMAAKKKAQKDATETHAALDKTKEQLATVTDERDKAMASVDDLTKRNETLSENLKKTTGERDLAQNDLAAWKALGIPIEHIKATLATIKTITEERDVISQEKKILLTNNKKLQEKINSLINPEYEPLMPHGLTGKVMVVDPRFDFVVLNIGEKQGVLEDGRLLVMDAKGKLVAKLRVKNVRPDSSIANVMPGWKFSEVVEGDQVVY